MKDRANYALCGDFWVRRNNINTQVQMKYNPVMKALMKNKHYNKFVNKNLDKDSVCLGKMSKEDYNKKWGK